VRQCQRGGVGPLVRAVKTVRTVRTVRTRVRPSARTAISPALPSLPPLPPFLRRLTLHHPGVAVSLVLLAAAPLAGVAQVAPSVVLGATVRAKPIGAGARWVQGNLVALTPDSVSIRVPRNGDTVSLFTGALAEFQVSQGRRARTGKGALLGLGIGAGTGLLLGIAASAESCTGFCEIEVGPEDVLAVAAILGGVGAGIGALIGAASHGERWQRVVEPHSAVRLGVHGGMLGMRIRF
jgi:hypothetical protein